MKKFIVLLTLLSILLLSVVPASASSYEIKTGAKARSCPRVSCAVVTQLAKGTIVDVIEIVEGDRFNGITQWLHIKVGSRDAYVHASLAKVAAGALPPTSNNNSGNSGNSTVNTTIPTQAPQEAPPASLTCGTCSQMTCQQAYACLAAGVSRLDRDGDGIPCESIC